MGVKNNEYLGLKNLLNLMQWPLRISRKLIIRERYLLLRYFIFDTNSLDDMDKITKENIGQVWFSLNE